MLPRHRFSLRLVGGLLACGLLALLALPALSDDPPKAPEEKVAVKAEANKADAAPANGAALSSEPSLPAEWTKALTWRCVGPAAMGGRIVALSVYEADPSTYWVATASGGLLKTTNNGVTFEHQFDKEATVSVGDVCVAPSDKNIVYVGTGENNPRNSVSYGDGVYKSTDGGRTWKNMGLTKTFQIGKIVVHPKNPNIVYVGALGRLYGYNPERGLFKTTDGGLTWEKVLYVDDKTGVIDVQMSPGDPETLLVATYERQRDLYDTNDPIKKWGPGTGLHKTSDGGKSFTKLTKGLPTCPLGRMGICYYRKEPGTVYLILESEKIGGGPKGTAAAASNATLGLFLAPDEDIARVARILEGGAAAKAGLKEGDVIVAVGSKPIKSNDDLREVNREHKVGDKVKVKIKREAKDMEIEVTYAEPPAGAFPGGGGGGGRGGADPNRPFAANLGGQQENVQDRQGPDSFQYGGVYKSTDGGESWTRINSVNPRPMYFSHLRVDPSDDKYLYVMGVSMYRSTDGGKTFRSDVRGIHADQHALWIDPRDGRHLLVGCDGGFYATYDRGANWDHLNTTALGQFYHVAIDTRPNYHVYGGLQDNGSWGGPSRTRTGTGPLNEDWISVGGGDGFVCRVDPNDPDQIYSESQGGAFQRRNLRTGEAASIRPRPADGQRFRFNWNSPFILSNHNSKIYYCAGNYVFRSLDRGNDLRMISKEITRTDKGSATALAESPRNPNVLYAGTDDGLLWVTRDGGREWNNITANVGLKAPMCVATIEPSRYEEGRCYVAFDGHRSDDDDPHVCVTEDYGKTWKELRGNLPIGSSRVLREDIQNANVLYLGTEFAAWTSVNRGQSWTKINNNLPTVAVHEFAQHPTTGELVAATHGRSIWIVDISPVRQATAQVLKDKAHLFKSPTAYEWRNEPRHGGTTRRFVGQNPPQGAQIYYSLATKAEKVSLKVVDYSGKTVRELSASTEPGLHKVAWNLAQPPQQRPGGGDAAAQGRTGGGRRTGAAGGQGGGQRPAGAAGAQGGAERPAGAAGAQGGAERETGEAQQPATTQPGGPGGGGGRFGGGGFGGFGGQPVPTGMYRVVLVVDGQEFSQGLRVEADPAGPATTFVTDDEEDDEDR